MARPAERIFTPREEFLGCPLCDGKGVEFKTAQCGERGMSPRDLTWMRCQNCDHVYAKHFFVGRGRDELLSVVAEEQTFGGNLDLQRWTWSGILNRILAGSSPVGVKLVDVGIGGGGCLFTADEMGFDAIGIDIRPNVLRTPEALGYKVQLIDAMDFDYAEYQVVVLADLLEHVPFPRELLTRIRKGLQGPLFVSCPNMDSVSWRYMDKKGQNVFWMDQEHYHNFTRKSLEKLLNECKFHVIEYAVSSRYQTCMEVIAV
jgi:2-polyprenyl-3-methyl-5-hydroxy-6-metoxy-1,4-benzoquinol methylase